MYPPYRKRKVLVTERLLLRPFLLADLEDFHNYCKNPNVGFDAGWKPHETVQDSLIVLSLGFLLRQNVWAVTVRESLQLIGSISLAPDFKQNYSQVDQAFFFDKRVKTLVDEFFGSGRDGKTLVPKQIYRKSPFVSSLTKNDVDEITDGINAQNADTQLLGYAFDEQYWGLGYATEAAKVVIDYAFNKLKIKTLKANTFTHNYRSQRVLKKCGFVHTGRQLNAVKHFNGELMDLEFFTLENHPKTNE